MWQVALFELHQHLQGSIFVEFFQSLNSSFIEVTVCYQAWRSQNTPQNNWQTHMTPPETPPYDIRNLINFINTQHRWEGSQRQWDSCSCATEDWRSSMWSKRKQSKTAEGMKQFHYYGHKSFPVILPGFRRLKKPWGLLSVFVTICWRFRQSCRPAADTHSCSFVPASWPPSTFTQAFVVTGVLSFDPISILQCDNDQSDAPSAICQQLIRLV